LTEGVAEKKESFPEFTTLLELRRGGNRGRKFAYCKRRKMTKWMSVSRRGGKKRNRWPEGGKEKKKKI